MKKYSLILTAGIITALIAGSVPAKAESTAESSELKTISIAYSADIIPSIERVEAPLAKLGYQLDKHAFDDWVMPNTALAEGDVLVNFFEHEPYMTAYNESTGADLVMVEPKIYSTPYGFFSNKYDSLEDLEKDTGISVALSDESSNRSRSFKLLEEAGLLTLSDEPLDEYYDEVDIVDNPYELTFNKADSNSLPALIADVDLVVVPCDLVNNAGGDATDTIYREKDTKYAMGLAVRSGDENDPGVLALNEAFHSEEFREALEADYPGVYQFVEEDDTASGAESVESAADES